MPQWTDKLGTNRCSFFDYSRMEHGEVVMHAVIQVVQRMKHAAPPQHRCLMSNDRHFTAPPFPRPSVLITKQHCHIR